MILRNRVCDLLKNNRLSGTRRRYDQAALPFADSQAAIDWQVADGEKIKSDEPFDLIVSSMSVQWFSKPVKSLERLRSMLRPGGQVLYSVPGADSFHEWRSVLDECGLPIGVHEPRDWPGVYKQEHNLIAYPSVYEFLDAVKHSGAGTAQKGYTPLSKAQLEKACSVYDARYRGKVTWHIVYGHLNAKP